MQVKVISLVQPWASFIIAGHKRVETRSWDTQHRGTLYIHASLKKSKLYEDIYNDLCNRFGITGMPAYNELPFGSIIGHASVSETFKFGSGRCEAWTSWMDKKELEKEMAMGNWEADRFGWELTHPTPIEPIPVRGKLSIWNYDLKPL